MHVFRAEIMYYSELNAYMYKYIVEYIIEDFNIKTIWIILFINYKLQYSASQYY